MSKAAGLQQRHIVKRKGGQPVRWEEAGTVIFCCDGMGLGAGHDPWCLDADPDVQQRFVGMWHLGVVDFSVTPTTCDDSRCGCQERDDA